MRINLQLVYWCLISITIISSGFLFLVVASESGARIIGAATEDVIAIAADVPDGGGAAAADVASPLDDGTSSGDGDGDGGSVVGVNYKHVNAAAQRFDKVKKEKSASRVRSKDVTSSLPSVNAEELSSSASATTASEGGAAAAVAAPSTTAKYSSEANENLLVSDGSVLSDADVVPISEGNVLQLEAPQVRVVDVDASGNGEVVPENTMPIGAAIDATSLPDISSENPAVITLNEITSTDLPLAGSLEARPVDQMIISKADANTINKTQDEDDIITTEDNQKDDQIEKINDSGGSIPPQPPENAEAAEIAAGNNIPSPMPAKASTNATVTPEVNLTAEEVPIPVFSEWAQKQMEAAEKQQLEQDVVNSSTQKKNLTTGSKQAPSKLRTKNYASPDCGAKIIASNSDAQNTGAVLTSSKDEYMLSPCTNRIWFVVELCEAIQAETIDLANFELFSSSPKNFTVAVSNRFPTRDWSNVGRFVADDKRTIQSFELHPHLFGKFVRADIHSHYNSEHFCPVSLFRVYGTSEFEAFETEDRAADDLDEYDDEIAFDQAHQKNENNLFKSASDAVLSIVKKAAEVLVKTNSNRTTMEIKSDPGCFTPSTGDFVCAQCKDTSLAAKVNYALSCRHTQLINLLSIERLRSDILTSQICAKRFSVNLDSHLDCKSRTSGIDVRNSYFLSLLPDDYVGALCQLLAERERKSQNDSMSDVGSGGGEQNGEISLNLTIDKGNGGAFGTLEKLPDVPREEVRKKPKIDANPNEEISAQIPPPPRRDDDVVSFTERTETPPAHTEPLDINIYNLPEVDNGNVATTGMPAAEVSATEEPKTDETTAEAAAATKAEAMEGLPKVSASGGAVENDPATWDNLDTLLAEGVPAGAVNALGGGVHGNQQRIASGGPHSESVFIRLNNRIKALERNMSLSGQYLEELSRRYKKQVEELQLSLTKTVRALEEQNHRHREQERALLEQNGILKEELDDVSLQVHACIVLIIFVGAFMILLTVLGVVFYRSMARSLRGNGKQTDKRKVSQKKLNRRKSFDDFSDASTGKQKVRRPSEEAMLILKDCAAENSAPESEVPNAKVRQRKISVFYGRKGNRKGEKRSWPEVSQPGEFIPGVEDLPPAEPVSPTALEDEEYDNFNASESDSICTSEVPSPNAKSSTRKLSSIFNGRGSKKTKKTNANYKRQESAPADICSTKVIPVPDSFDEKLILDEDDIENFIPGADLAYNEFMPDGPSGYQITDASKQEEARKSGKKSRRLSSPAFFKSAFSKSSKKSPPHESTSWEWYRSKKSSSITSSQQQPIDGKASGKVNGFGSATHSQPSPASSLSEILPNSGQGSSDNSFRILEEAINTSTIATSSSSNGNSGGGSNSGSSAGSGRSSKKNRSFNRIFKKINQSTVLGN